MKANMGTVDRTVRIIIALVIGTLYYFKIIPNDTVGLVLMIVAIIFVATSFISFCPLYWPFGISTKKKSD